MGSAARRLGLLGGLLVGPALVSGAGHTRVPDAPVAAQPGDSLRGWLNRITGFSGKLRAIAVTLGGHRASTLADLVPALGSKGPGVHSTGLATDRGDSLVMLSMLPLSEKVGSVWHGYRVGFWPRERARRAVGDTTLPEGFLEVTPDNQDTRLSEHFRVRDFLTHDQAGVWPKMLVIRLPLLDKLELIRGELLRRGKPADLTVMSGFRTPQYNERGVGAGGRARDSRHMYGEAADVFVDADGDGRMDDLNGDGRVTRADAAYLVAVAEAVEARYPALVGGLSAYRATGAHGPFVHVDIRGRPARW